MVTTLRNLLPLAVALCCNLLFVNVSALAATELLAEEQALVDYIDQQFDEQIAFLERVVNINSGTMNHEGVRRVASIFEKELGALGFATRWIDLRESLNRAGHLVAERSGETGARLLLIGHMDTVHPLDGAFQTFKRDGDRATGPGIDDMKNGDVVMLYALKALAHIGGLEDAAIRVFMTGEEEMPGDSIKIARAPLIESAQDVDVALNFESGEPGVAVSSRRGYTGWRLETKGKRSHSSRVFSEEVGAGAIYEIARILTRFYQELRHEPLLTFNPGVLVGGTTVQFDAEATRGEAFGKVNVVAQHANVQGDIRAISTEQVQRTISKMKEIAAQNLPQTSAELVFFDGYPPMSPTAANNELLQLYSDISDAVGAGPLEPNDPLQRGAGDISFVAPIVLASLDGLGGYGGGAHTEDEWIDLETMRQATHRAAILIHRLTRESGAQLVKEWQ